MAEEQTAAAPAAAGAAAASAGGSAGGDSGGDSGGGDSGGAGGSSGSDLGGAGDDEYASAYHACHRNVSQNRCLRCEIKGCRNVRCFTCENVKQPVNVPFYCRDCRADDDNMSLCFVNSRQTRRVQPKPALIHASPPCKGYSQASASTQDQKQMWNSLTTRAADIIVQLKPPVAILENVLTARQNDNWKRAVARLNANGYHSVSVCLDACKMNIGVPQTRKRLFVVLCHRKSELANGECVLHAIVNAVFRAPRLNPPVHA